MNENKKYLIIIFSDGKKRINPSPKKISKCQNIVKTAYRKGESRYIKDSLQR